MSTRRAKTLTTDTYDHFAPGYSQEIYRYFTDSEQERIGGYLEYLDRSSLILDIGCGSGQVTKYIHDRGFDIIGTDISGGMLGEAKMILPSGKLLLMDMDQICFRDHSFDAVVCRHVLHHSIDIGRSLKTLLKVLRADGYIYLSLHISCDKLRKEIWHEFSPESGSVYLNLLTRDDFLYPVNDVNLELLSQDTKEFCIDYDSLHLICRKCDVGAGME